MRLETERDQETQVASSVVSSQGVGPDIEKKPSSMGISVGEIEKKDVSLSQSNESSFHSTTETTAIENYILSDLEIPDGDLRLKPKSK
jgi:hypothetical protein